ncbi:MAG: CNP1-like family protein [Betaproteobacteria bacterium]|nr:CNP1-like family protein [Betaproteobacteria bacterium]MDH5342331.1 CNP1-like family protein [Betaproteobacteria bacterium]
MKTHLKHCVVAGLLFSGLAQAQWEGWDYAFDREIKPWSEMQAQLPGYPVDENLIPLDVGAATPHRFFVDSKSVSVDADSVVRYTLVIKTAGGATNVSYEGIRCASREQKYYAIGRADKTWVRARRPEWHKIEHKDVNAHHITLYGEYVCRGKIVMETAGQIIEALRRGPPRSGFGG